MSDLPIVGDKYLHRNSGREYYVDECIPIKLDGIWYDDGLVVYHNHETDTKYSRLVADFIASFDHV